MKKIADYINMLKKGTDERSFLIKKNVIASFLIKGWASLVQLLLVPLTLSCLGTYENSVWLTIYSTLLLVDNLDIGLGNGLRNKLAIYLSHDDNEKAREMVSSTFFMLAMIITPVALLIIGFVLTVDCYPLFNFDATKVPDLNVLLIVTTVLVCTTFVFKFLGNFYMGLQMPAINNLLVTLGNTLSLVCVSIIYLTGIHSLLLVGIACTMSPLLVYLVCYPITFYGKYKHLRPKWSSVKLSSVREMSSLGVKFFVLQISGIILFFSVNLIISHLYNPEVVTPYQIAHRYFNIALLLFTIICVPYWTATTDAYERRDFEWIKRANRKLNKFMLLITLLIVVMILASGFVYSIWIGDKAEIPFYLTVMCGLFQLLLLYSMRYSFVLNGIGALRIQLIFTAIAAVSYILLVCLIAYLDADFIWLLVVMCAVNVPGLIMNAVQYHKIINGKATGIWLK